MWSKMKSLSFKLTLFYIISIFLIVGCAIAAIEYQKYENTMSDTLRNAEIGPGFINGAIPNDEDEQIVSNKPDSAYALKPSDIDNWLARFTPLFDTRVEGGVHVQNSLDGPLTINHQDYYNLTFDVTNIKSGYQFRVGPITISKSNFAATIAASDMAFQYKRFNDLYYLPVPGRNNLIFVVSVNAYDFPVQSWKSLAIPDLVLAFPFILLLSFIFSLLLSWITISPLKKITRTTELMSRSDLSQRVKYKSGDEIGRLARSFNTMADRLEESFNSQKRFISDAAHELRTPLASMKTSVTKALSSARTTEDYPKLLDFLSGRINHMESLVNDLLFLSRIDEGRSMVNETRLDLSKVLAEAEEAFRYLFEDKGIGFTTEIEPELYDKGDPQLMLRVISNLLDNAAKNTPSGGSVTFRANKQGKEVMLTVSDTGSGIPEEHSPHLFERFYKVPGSSGTSAGYGLGLAISKSIVVSSGGDISVQSEPGKGSTFTIKLPQYSTLHF
jgi:two-component system heavy metal sensor histidine kinase CusS